MSQQPTDAPPAYSRIDPQASGFQGSTHLNVPRNGISSAARRSMEDEARELPAGWVRQYDADQHHQYFVDTHATPPRSTWTHPYDDEEYLSTLPSAERERIQSLTMHSSYHDIMAESSDDEEHHQPAQAPPPQKSQPSSGSSSAQQTANSSSSAALPPREEKKPKSFGRKMKDKVTGTTHEQREAYRKQRAQSERESYELHMAFRRALVKSMQTGQPEFVGRNPQGKDVYVQPPQGGPGYFSAYGSGGYALNPCDGGVYGRPNTLYLRPTATYNRPYGRGFGGGYGLPLAAGLGGGMLLGGALGGF